MRLIQQFKADFIYARGALRTLQRTQPIRAKSDARVSGDHRRARRSIWRRAGADLGSRASQLPGARRTRQPLRALGTGARPCERRRGLPDDAEPARIHGDLARADAGRRRRRADQHQPHRRIARLLHQCGPAQGRHRREPNCWSKFATRARTNIDAKVNDLGAWRKRREPAAHRPGDLAQFSDRPRWRRTSAPRSPSRTARSTSTRRARPACPRRPTSITTG